MARVGQAMAGVGVGEGVKGVGVGEGVAGAGSEWAEGGERGGLDGRRCGLSPG